MSATTAVLAATDARGYVADVIASLETAHADQPEFLQAAREVLQTLHPVFERHATYRQNKILERLVVPDRMIIFRVAWIDDHEEVQVNTGYRVQFSSSLGPYKGGLRFHPTVNLSVLKFLGFEQIFKNALTDQPIGAGKGGADFDPKGKSDHAVMRFCQAFMTELARHIGSRTDVPAGDIGVGSREVGYLFGYYKKLLNRWTGVLTGKSPYSGGSLLRTEATGYGTVYFAGEMLSASGSGLDGRTAVVSGSGNVAIYATEKLTQLGARVVTLSDSSGFIHDPAGLDAEKIEFVKELKEVRRGRISEYAERFEGVRFVPLSEYEVTGGVWAVPCELALPCATQNELDASAAHRLIEGGVRAVSEGANMPCTIDAAEAFHEAGVLFGPGKAANAGGVAVSSLEMTQNAQRERWTRDQVDERLRAIMHRIFEHCQDAATEYGVPGDYASGANIAGFYKVAEAMEAQGVV
ncbi:MAG: NADP-specific glutamate dehydrogenase [Planctomycetota bacterium]